MRRLLLLLLVFLAIPAFAADPKLDDLKWIAGHWAATIDGVAMEEVWLPPSGGMMLGMHRDVSSRTFFEFIRIAATKDGIAYLAQPGGKPPTAFKLIESKSGRVVFANPQHDYPQRILYWLKAGKLCARVEGKMEGKDASEEWCWSKKK